MSRRKISLTEKNLRRLYLERKLTPQQIGEVFSCSFATVRNRLKEYHIPLRPPSIARQRFDKENFSGDPVEAAYLVGFRIGDLNVYVPNLRTSSTLVARCHTTDVPQVNLMKEIFSKYGAVRVSKSIHGYSVNCFLNRSFDFLITKEMAGWIVKNDETAAAFIAGYVDAEGNFILNQGRGRFKLDSYDVEILSWIHGWLIGQGVRSMFRQIAKKGQRQRINGKWGVYHQDLWRLNVNEAVSLKKFIKIILSYLKHSRRLQHAKAMLENVQTRIRYGTVKDS